MSTAETTVELAVELSCQKCVDKTNTVLSKADKVSDFKVDLKTQSVLVTSSLPSSQLIDLIGKSNFKISPLDGDHLKINRSYRNSFNVSHP